MTMSNPTRKDCELPLFSPSNIDFWFKSVELILTAKAYNDDEMYECLKNYLLDNDLLLVLDDEIGAYIIEDIPEFPRGRRYRGLKEHFLAQANEDFDGMENKIRLAGLFSCRDLKPSAFLQMFDTVFRDYVPNWILRTFFMSRLPRRFQKLFFAAVILDPRPLEDRSLEELAAVADGIAAYEKYHSHPQTKKQQIKLPDFKASDPELWFYSLDEAFSANGIRDDQLKFEYTMDTLQYEELRVAALFLTDILNQPNHNKYANLKERIIKTFDLIQNDEVYSFVFRIKHLKPSPLLKLLNDMAANCTRVIPQLLVRTFWIMLLPIKIQAVLFRLLATSRETLQDMDIEALALVADSYTGKVLFNVHGRIPASRLENQQVDNQQFKMELQSAVSFKQKIEFGMKYCDFMYRTYYKNNLSESIKNCTTLNTPHKSKYTAQDFYFEGCECQYHERFGESANNCMEVVKHNHKN